MANLHQLALHLPDEDRFTPADVDLIRWARPSMLLAMRYPWDSDKGAAEATMGLVRELGHDRLLVRFHDEAIPQKEPRQWARDCVRRMAIYEPLRADRVALECIPENEPDLADPEGGHHDWNRHADWMGEFATEWRRLSYDPLHLPAPSRQPIGNHDWNEWNTAMAYWTAIRDAGVHERVDRISCHAYRGDFERAGDECYAIFKDHLHTRLQANDEDGGRIWITETNGDGVIAWAARAVAEKRYRAVVWFTAGWRFYQRSGGVDRTRTRTEEMPMNGGTPMSLDKWPHLRDEWDAARDQQAPIAEPPAEPTPAPAPPGRGEPLDPGTLPQPAPEPREEPIPMIAQRSVPGSAVVDAIYRFSGGDPVITKALLGLAWAESGDRMESWDRWHKWTNEALPAIEANDRAKLQEILDRGRALGTRDYSFGPFHQSTWGLPAGVDPWELDTVLAFRERFFDVDDAVDYAWGSIDDHIMLYGLNEQALGRYNKPDGSASAGVIKRYRDGLTAADATMASRQEQGDEAVAQFQHGFKAKADELGADVVGEPLEDETYIGDNFSRQFTERGILFYSVIANKVHFVAGQ